MSARRMVTMDGNEAVASVAHRINEVIAIYPITPSSNMGEWADEWSAKGRRNIWGTVPSVVEMQSEGGAAGAVHGALQGGALTTTFTASQGLLLMIPNMYKIAGELTAFCMHVSARSLATHALSIFGDHSDIMAVRQTGFGLLASNSVQEAHDLAAIAQRASLASRIPFLHFFDGFRTSHEVAKIELLEDEDLRAMIPDDWVAAHRARALSPEHPVMRGTAQNPDVFFQAREACNRFYSECPSHVEEAMRRFGELTGRHYRLFEYVGAADAERVIVTMGSSAEVVHETVEHLAAAGERVGVVKVRLYRPFSIPALMAVLPPSTRALAVLDRTKEPGSPGEPLYQDVVTGLAEAGWQGRVIGGRYGLSSKDFTPAMAKAVFDELASPWPKRHFTVGITDDVSDLSLACDPAFNIERDDVVRALFHGLGADGTVGANKNSIKIIGEDGANYAQGYFVYDSKKSGTLTTSHLRFGPRPIHSSYLVTQANFIACHQFNFLEKYDLLEPALPGATFLLNSPHPPESVWRHLPREVQRQIIDKKLKFHVIDAYRVARDSGLGVRINTIMQVAFFALSGLFPREEAIRRIKGAIEKSYGRKGEAVVQKNFQAVDRTLAHLHEVTVPQEAPGHARRPTVSAAAPEFVQRVTAVMLAGRGDKLPVSALPVDGTWPTGTTRWEKRAIAAEIPVVRPELCIQCNKCTLICPHASLRAKFYPSEALLDAPPGFVSMDFRSVEHKGAKYSLQAAPEDCTGCTLCVEICPAHSKTDKNLKALYMQPVGPRLATERANFEFFLSIPEADRTTLKLDVKNAQFLQPLFEFSGACTGCGETPYIKLLTQLYGERSIISNATGCSSIFGGNLPTAPYTVNREGRGPAWSNSLFEDNAEFGFGIRLALDKQAEQAREILVQLGSAVGEDLVKEILGADQSSEAGLAAQRERVRVLKQKLARIDTFEAQWLAKIADQLVRKNVWIVGGDGWAYDIGYGGLDHVIAMGKDVNILVLDTEVYSNTGGQASKATPLGAAAKFATAGKPLAKKDLAMLAITYGHAYVARVAIGAKDAHAVNAFKEAESYPGTSLIIAYAHCIAHGLEMAEGLEHQERAVASGYWPLFRYDPRRIARGESPLKLDSPPGKVPLSEFFRSETRFRMVEQANPEAYPAMLQEAERQVRERYAFYEQLSKAMTPANATGAAARPGA